MIDGKMLLIDEAYFVLKVRLLRDGEVVIRRCAGEVKEGMD